MMKVRVDGARVDVRANFARSGSVLKQTIRAECTGVEIHLMVDSPGSSDEISGVLRNAEAGCYVMQTFKNPTPVTTTYELNGFDLQV